MLVQYYHSGTFCITDPSVIQNQLQIPCVFGSLQPGDKVGSLLTYSESAP